MTYRKKLIEVALPLEAINAESAREKSIRHGHPSTLHLWWARRPLAACRAVLWSSLVDDPASWPEKFPTEEAQNAERQRLFDILARFETETDKKGNQKQVVRGLVSWDEVNDPKSQVLPIAQKEIARCLAWERGEEPPTELEAVREYIARYAPPAYDPFAGGGSIPLEAQRLGLEAHASDLNPVAVLINKALIEIPPKFRDQPPTNPADRVRAKLESWKGAQGLAADVRYYGQWMRDEAFKQIGHLYPKVELPQDLGGGEATVIAWLWARTVQCPNPACGCRMPLVRSFQLSTKKGKEAWVEPVIDRSVTPPIIGFEVKTGDGDIPDSPKTGRGANFRCLACSQPTGDKYIKAEGVASRISAQLMAIVAERKSGRTYIPANETHTEIADLTRPIDIIPGEMPNNPRWFSPPAFGLLNFVDLFTPRQLGALTTFSDLVGKTLKKVIDDAIISGLPNDDIPLNDGGNGARAYGEAIATYLAFLVDQLANHQSNICSWHSRNEQMRNVFARQAIPMTWDFAESNPFCDSSGSFSNLFERLIKGLGSLDVIHVGKVHQHDAMADYKDDAIAKLISTDPPYYDNIGYADLSDFFYIWLRRALNSVYPSVCSTLLVPKERELVATPYRFGGSKQKAQTFFEEGLGKAFNRMYKISHTGYPLTVYYAFKQAEVESNSEGNEDSIASTGWETMLEGLIKADFSIGGTWPMRSEMSNRMVSSGTNALASSIVLVCRPRPTDAPKATRRQFTSELKRELPPALRLLQQGNIAPVDLAQASIGPGMAIYSKYAAVLEADGSSMRVRAALQLINQILDEYLTEQEGEFDGDTRWALTWFEQHQFSEGVYGDAETLSKAKNTSVQGLVEAGILEAKAGKVRLLPRSELAAKWQPDQDNRMPVWEITQHLIRALDQTGETGAANMLAKLGDRGSLAKDLAYRLYSLCDRKNWSQEALAYNSLVISWPEITRLANEIQPEQIQQVTLAL
jgi:putative DNA methylase